MYAASQDVASQQRHHRRVDITAGLHGELFMAFLLIPSGAIEVAGR